MSDIGFSEEELKALFENEEAEENEGKSKKAPAIIIFIIKVISVLIAIALALAASIYSYHWYQNKKEQQSAPVAESASVELVNLQQVNWAKQLCSYSFPNLSDDLMSIDDKSLNKTRSNMIKILNDASSEAQMLSQNMLSLPQEVYNQSLVSAESIQVVDNYRVVNDVDPKVYSSSAGMSLAFSDYQKSLVSMTSDLQSVADYDASGMRSAMSRISTSFPEINNELNRALSHSVSEDSFDNISTMYAVSQIESCDYPVVDENRLRDNFGESLSKQLKINEFSSMQRCKGFLSNVSSSSTHDEETSSNIDSCNSLLSSSTIGENDPVSLLDINNMDSQRIPPKLSKGKEPSTIQEKTKEAKKIEEEQ